MNIQTKRFFAQSMIHQKISSAPKLLKYKIQHSFYTLLALLAFLVCLLLSSCAELPTKSKPSVMLPVEFVDFMPMEKNRFQRISQYFGYEYEGNENETPRLLIFHINKTSAKKELLAAVNVDGVVVNDYSRKSVFAISFDGKTLLYMHDQPVYAPKDLQDKMPGLYEYVHGKGDRLIYPNAGFIAHTTFHLAKNAMEYALGDANDPNSEHYIRNTDGNEFLQESGSVIPYSGTSLHTAAEKGDIARIDSLIRKGVDLETRDNRGFTALHAAIWEKQELAAMRLIEEGANVKSRMNGSLAWSPLEEAARFGLSNVVNLLLDLSIVTKNGVDINSRNESGSTPLHLALDYRKHTVAQILIDRGADINAVRKADSATPLHLFSGGLRDERSAEWAGSQVEKLLQMLITKGAIVNARDSRKATPLHYAVLKNNLKTANVLINNGALTDEVELANLRYQGRKRQDNKELLTLQQRIEQTLQSDWWKSGTITARGK